MPRISEHLSAQIVRLLNRDPGQPVKELAKQLKLNRTYLAGYLRALEDQGLVKSKEIGPAKIYFNNREKEE